MTDLPPDPIVGLAAEWLRRASSDPCRRAAITVRPRVARIMTMIDQDGRQRALAFSSVVGW